MRSTRQALPLVLAAVLVGCGGGGGASHAVLPVSGASNIASAGSTANFTLRIPAKSAQAQSRSAQYISVNTESVIITLVSVNGAAFSGPQAETAANLTTSNPACSGSPLTCAITVPAAAGVDVFNVVTYGAQQTGSAPATPAGSVLSTGTVSVNVVSGQANAPATALVLNGVVASVVATFPTDPHISGTQGAGYAIVGAQPYTLSVSALDASGATIVGDGAPTFTATSASNAVAVSASANNTFAVQVHAYSSGPVTLAVTPSSGSATSIALTTTQEMWVSDYTRNVVTAYGLSPTPVQISTDTISTGLNSPLGLAVDANGRLWVANNSSGGTVNAYVPGTNVPISGDTISAGLSYPCGLAFDASGNLWVSDDRNQTITAYVPGTNTPIAGDTIDNVIGVAGPQDLAFDASGHLWVADASGQVNAYNLSPTPTQITADTITAGLLGPDGLAFSASGILWVADQRNSTVTAYTPPTAIAGNTVSAGVNAPQQVRFDATGRMWVANQSGGTVTAYAPGATTPMSSDTISGLNTPGGLAFSP